MKPCVKQSRPRLPVSAARARARPPGSAMLDGQVNGVEEGGASSPKDPAAKTGAAATADGDAAAAGDDVSSDATTPDVEDFGDDFPDGSVQEENLPQAETAAADGLSCRADDSGAQDQRQQQDEDDDDDDDAYEDAEFAPPPLTRGRSSSSVGAWLTEDDEESLIVDILHKSTDQAEARLAARRQARAEAREIRMRELERQQKEAEENADRLYDMHPETALRTPPVRSVSQSRTPVVNNTNSSGGSGGSNHQWSSSRRSSEDSLEDGGGPGSAERDGRSVRDLRHELKEVEDKFRKAMIQNAQLDNEKASYTYQVELLKDKVEDLEVAYAQLQRENREKCREADQLKRLSQRLKEDLDMCRAALEERDLLIQEQGLVIVGDEGDLDGCEDGEKRAPRKALVSVESAEMLQKAGEGSLDVRLRKLAEERNELLDQIRHLKLELEEERSRHRNGPRTLNGPADSDMEDLQREAQKLLGDYKFKLQKAEQDVSTLQANVARLESQVIRYKSAAETAEKVEDELKVEKRKLQRELRESLAHAEELETANSHLQRRLDKLKNAKSALFKDL
ncbi:Leucine-rich repeat flightless-interacting protein 2 [Frankliniella fusca]|uniref:Leucine-rich repeat flightless-interacting protein 2 n=1 Tax=Frankliniella fusca TaxID=407009 RepID=A0AAE1HZ41_9NEOP|nr:Leucine-rich repeat flightless-interacting protein 2 [Frankliniella fusca]